jgi:hypothetical protein
VTIRIMSNKELARPWMTFLSGVSRDISIWARQVGAPGSDQFENHRWNWPNSGHQETGP